jgi:hypothetical protein
VQDKNRAELTVSELKKMPADTTMYRQVGKMFVMVSFPITRSSSFHESDQLLLYRHRVTK